MPLAFETLNRGTVAFGFFNIDVDMILLNGCFFFAGAFCDLVKGLAQAQNADEYQTQFNTYVIEEAEAIGDLMGAIRGIHYQGFIGDVYRRFPFPTLPEEFRQKPNSYTNRSVVEAMIQRYATMQMISFLYQSRFSRITIGNYQFSEEGFTQLIRYIWNGGAPRWENNERPLYVIEMMEVIEQSDRFFLKIL